MKIKINKISITAVAIAIAVSALGSGYYYATQNSAKNTNTFAATSLYNVQNREGISLNPSEMAKLNYEYRTATNRSQQTEVQDFNMFYVMDASGSRIGHAMHTIRTIPDFIDSINMSKNKFAFLTYGGNRDEAERLMKMSNIDISSLTVNVNKLTTLYSIDSGNWSDEGRMNADSVNYINPALRTVLEETAKNGKTGVLVFESDFMDFPYRDVAISDVMRMHEGFLNTATKNYLKSIGYKVVLIGDKFHIDGSRLETIEDGFSYKTGTLKADGGPVDRGDILRMFVQTTVKETTTSPNTAYELSLRGTNYKFSPNFLAEMRKNSNFVVEGEDFIRLKVPEFNAQLNSANKPSPVSVAFSGVDVVYRSNSIQPQAVEYLSVKKDSTSDRIAINFTAPTAQEQTIYVNDEIKAEDSISNVAQLPNGATYKFKEEVDVSTKGKKEATVVVTYGDGMVVEVPVIINVLPKSNVTVKYLDTDGKELKPEVKLLEQQKEGTEYKAEQLDIEGYKFLKMDEKSAQVEGKLGEEYLEVIFIYEKVIVAPNTGLKSTATLPIILVISSVFGIIGAFWAKRR